LFGQTSIGHDILEHALEWYWFRNHAEPIGVNFNPVWQVGVVADQAAVLVALATDDPRHNGVVIARDLLKGFVGVEKLTDEIRNA
jgi:hypothetical protein